MKIEPMTATAIPADSGREEGTIHEQVGVELLLHRPVFNQLIDIGDLCIFDQTLCFRNVARDLAFDKAVDVAICQCPIIYPRADQIGIFNNQIAQIDRRPLGKQALCHTLLFACCFVIGVQTYGLGNSPLQNLVVADRHLDGADVAVAGRVDQLGIKVKIEMNLCLLKGGIAFRDNRQEQHHEEQHAQNDGCDAQSLKATFFTVALFQSQIALRARGDGFALCVGCISPSVILLPIFPHDVQSKDVEPPG